MDPFVVMMEKNVELAEKEIDRINEKKDRFLSENAKEVERFPTENEKEIDLATDRIEEFVNLRNYFLIWGT